MEFYQQTLNDYLEKAASKNPTPGGGSVSAVVAANAAAMVAMVANLTINRKGYETYWEQAREARIKIEASLHKLKLLTEADIEAFKQLMSAWRNKDDRETYSEAVKNAIEVPLNICRQCKEILSQASIMAPIGNKSAISDIGVAAYLADGALNAAMLNVDINLPQIDDESLVKKIVEDKKVLIESCEELRKKIIKEVQMRL